MDSREDFRKSKIEKCEREEASLFKKIQTILSQWGTKLPSFKEGSLEFDPYLTDRDRAYCRVTIRGGEVIDPVVVIPPRLDPRLLWFPDYKYQFDNAHPEPFHQCFPRVVAAGEVESLIPTRFLLSRTLREQARDLMGPAGLDGGEGVISWPASPLYMVAACDVFGCWGDLVGADIPAEASVNQTSRLLRSRNSLLANRDFLANATVILADMV
jgi:hypothetical protein